VNGVNGVKLVSAEKRVLHGLHGLHSSERSSGRGSGKASRTKKKTPAEPGARRAGSGGSCGAKLPPTVAGGASATRPARREQARPQAILQSNFLCRVAKPSPVDNQMQFSCAVGAAGEV